MKAHNFVFDFGPKELLYIITLKNKSKYKLQLTAACYECWMATCDKTDSVSCTSEGIEVLKMLHHYCPESLSNYIYVKLALSEFVCLHFKRKGVGRNVYIVILTDGPREITDSLSSLAVVLLLLS